ncbi:MAG: AAA family ATPase [Proteobacteria bacterium]|nr:AAA family ATPase [Desulfobacteraceae bacterium]MBU3980380.1 AAA family ATPase [Pseudomonadota bacterium]MBU4014029.1 AAA family ATPase [Pseudomonadota bacterium]MBU4066866.1 AAA family ATPase [Pseudomonadota bacterium]MBU4100585.1 AAA family ATPase [Pseudomonadota bacterium]
MKEHDEKIPDPREIEKEIGEFLSKRFGNSVKVVSPIVFPQEAPLDKAETPPKKEQEVNFDLKPEDLVSYLDQYIVKQDEAKAILATKICTHFNRIKYVKASPEKTSEILGSIKNNILMIGPTGVGKTYMIRLIAKKIGVPFVKGDATKFSETGYVGGDVEDLIRDLVREANDDIELAQNGIVYIDELDKIAASRNIIGADVSRTGVQRALLKPMEETDVDLKVPHDPISMIQEIERFRKTGKREKRSVNTKNILFIMSGAFSDITEIIKKRLKDRSIGFGSKIISAQEKVDILKHVKAEDLIEYGFETEFVGRLPVKAVFDNLTEDDLYEILKNPNNPIILGKKLDFAAYGIDVKFEDKVLRVLAKSAFEENTGARGLVSAIEKALILFENKLPSTSIKKFPAIASEIEDQKKYLKKLLSVSNKKEIEETFERLEIEEKKHVIEYVTANKNNLSNKYNLTLTPSRIDIVASYYCKNIMDIGSVIKNIKSYYDDIKKIELYFFKNSNINIVLEENAIDFIIEQLINFDIKLDNLYKKLTNEFEYGLKLVREKTGKNRFFITKEALLSPEPFISQLIKDELKDSLPT